MNLEQCLVIAGPTGTGKSQVAVELAEQLCRAEIVNIDAYQVYRGLEVLTAAPDSELRSRVPHHLVACAELSTEMDAASYARLARDVIRQVTEHGHTAIVVGGSGLYLSAVFGAVSEMPAADATTREHLEEKSTTDLLVMLDRLDPVAGQKIDRKNRRRVVRAVEVCLLSGQPYSSMRSDWSEGVSACSQGYPPAVLLCRPREELLARIAKRTREMLESGAIAEVRQAGAAGSTASQALGVKEIRQYLAGATNLDGCYEKLLAATRQYAKRQLTWFRNRTDFPEIDIAGMSASEAASAVIRSLGLNKSSLEE